MRGRRLHSKLHRRRVHGDVHDERLPSDVHQRNVVHDAMSGRRLHRRLHGWRLFDVMLRRQLHAHVSQRDVVRDGLHRWQQLRRQLQWIIELLVRWVFVHEKSLKRFCGLVVIAGCHQRASPPSVVDAVASAAPPDVSTAIACGEEHVEIAETLSRDLLPPDQREHARIELTRETPPRIVVADESLATCSVCGQENTIAGPFSGAPTNAASAATYRGENALLIVVADAARRPIAMRRLSDAPPQGDATVKAIALFDGAPSLLADEHNSGDGYDMRTYELFGFEGGSLVVLFSKSESAHQFSIDELSLTPSAPSGTPSITTVVRTHSVPVYFDDDGHPTNAMSKAVNRRQVFRWNGRAFK